MVKKELLRNPFILAGILLVSSIVLGAVVFFISSLLKIGSSSPSLLAGLFSAFVVGQIYAVQFKEPLSSKRKLQVTVINALVQLVLGTVYALLLVSEDLVLFLGILFAATLFYSIFIYLMLGLGGTSYLRAQERARQNAPSSRRKK